MIAAILRAQWLSMRLGSHRGGALGFIVGFFWYGFWIGVAYAANVAASRVTVETLRYSLPLVLLGVCCYWQAMPLLSASMGSSLDLRKLLVYPTPHEKLFAVELLLRLTTAIEMQLVLIGGAIGLVRNPAAGGWSIAPALVGGFGLFILFNVLLASGTRSLFDRLMARRKLREVIALMLALFWVGPRFVMMTGYHPPWLHQAGETLGAFAWPWSAAARAALPLTQPGGATLLSWLSLMVWVALAERFGRTQFERSLRYDSLAAQATPMKPLSARSRRWSERFYRLPALLWSDPLAAIVEKELRTLARSSRFRTVFVMGFTFGLMFWLPTVLRRGGSQPGPFGRHFLVIVCVYAMTLLGQVSYWNCFGIDRSAAMFYFAAPQPMSRTLLGKNIAILFFVYLEALVLIVITLAIHVRFGIAQVVETLVVIGICAVYLLAMGNISSVNYPRALSPERVSQGSSNRGQAMVMLLYPLVLLPVILAYIARYAFDSQTAFAIVLAIAAAIGGTFYWIAMESAVKAAGFRRQYILEELSKGDGPISS